MKNHKLAGSICALLLTVLGTSSAVAQTSTASILFARTVYRFDGQHGTQLYRVKPSGANVVTLAPVTYGYDILSRSWSPSGGSVVYELAKQLFQGLYSESQLYVVDRQGGSRRQITTGAGDMHQQALWGPNGTIAFVTGNCLGTVHADGTQQHIVFCPPLEPGEGGRRTQLSLSQWTASGKSVLIVFGGDEGGLEPSMWYSSVYRVNVSTGAAVKLAAQVFDNSPERDLTIAPDGTHGVYSGNTVKPMEAIDFASNSLTPLPNGWDPVYSQDGSKIAFLFSSEPEQAHQRVYIMRSDGSHVHLAPAQTNPDVTITSISGWSPDGTRLLMNQEGNNQWVRMIDLRDKTARNVTNGVANRYAWFHP